MGVGARVSIFLLRIRIKTGFFWGEGGGGGGVRGWWDWS